MKYFFCEQAQNLYEIFYKFNRILSHVACKFGFTIAVFLKMCMKSTMTNLLTEKKSVVSSVDVKPSTTETYSGLLDSIEEIAFDYPPDSGWDRDLEKEFDQEHFAKQLLIYKIDFILYLWVILKQETTYSSKFRIYIRVL